MERINLRRSLLFVTCLVVVLAAAVVGINKKSEGPVALEDVEGLDLPHVRSSFSPANRGDDAQARREYEVMRLRDPSTGRIPTNIRQRELAFVRDLPRVEEVAGKAARVHAQDWSFRGPTNLGGRTRALKIDLDYNGTSNRRMLAGGISGGMFLSEDDGQSWALTSGVAGLASVTSLAQDPSNHNVWYFGTGEFLGNSAGGGLQQYYGQGLFKSTDNGRTWSQVLSTREGKATVFDSLWDYVWNVAVHPNGTVFAATFGGVFRSTDGGTNWEYVVGRSSQNDPFNTITDVAVAANGDVYATLSRNGSQATTYGVFKSTDGGNQWQNVTPPGLGNDPYRMVLGTAPSDANTVYLLVQSNQQGAQSSDHQLFRLNAGTGSWSDLSNAIPNEQGVEGNASFSSQGGYDLLVVVKPDNPEAVFIGGTNLYRSTNGGASFDRIGGYSSPANYGQFDNHHSDQHALVFLPTNPNVAISGNDGGLAKSANVLAQPHSWTSLNNNYTTTQYYTIAIDPAPGGTWLIGGLQDNGTWGTDANGGASQWAKLFGGDGAHAAVAPGATALYVSAQNGQTFRLTPNTFTAITPAGAQQFMFINPFVLDPNDPKVMYMGEAGGVWRNSNLDGIPDGNQQPTSVNWTFLNTSAQSGSRTTAITAAKTPANRVYFGTTNFQTQSALIRVDDAAGNGAGTVITPPITAGQIPPFPSSIAVNPSNGDEIIATFSNYNMESIWYSTNAGASWTNIDGNLGGESGPSARTAAIVPTNQGTIYFVGTSSGIYSTTSLSGAGTTWALEGGDVLGNVVVDMLAVRPEDQTIVAGSHGRGVYQATIGQGGEAAVATLSISDLTIEAQPGATGTAQFTLTNSGTATLNYTIGAVGKRSGIASKHALRPGTAKTQLPSRAKRGLTSGFGGAAAHSAREDVAGTSAAVASVLAGSPASTSAGDFLILDDGNDLPDDFLGWGDGATPFFWGSRFYAPVGGYSLEGFYVYMRSEFDLTFPVEVYITDPDGAVFISGTVDLPVSGTGGWYQITFSPIALPEGQVFDIELITSGSILYPAGADATAQVTGSSFYWVNSGLDGFYTEIGSITGFENGAWLIRADGTASGGSVNQPPTADIAASKTQVTINETITFNGSGSRDPDGSIASYSWDFGDGGNSNQQTANHAYSSPGTYTVGLTVTDNEGATGSATVQVTAVSDNQLPIARIQASKIQAEVNEQINFDGSGSSDGDGSVQSYAWSFGDGATSTQQTAGHSYAQAGAYTVSLTVTDNEGGTGQATTQVTVLAEAPRLTATPVSGSLGPGQSQVITVTYDASTQVAGTYSGQVSLSTNGGNLNIPVSIVVDPTVDIEEVEPDSPQRFALEQNYPNPFSPPTTIAFSLEQPRLVRLTVYDVGGRMVRELVDGHVQSGRHSVTWDGNDTGGRSMASGTYFCRLEAYSANGERVLHVTRKMTLVR